MDSILETIKTMIGPSASYDVFDTDLVTHINTTFFTLNQLGVGPEKPFVISDYTSKWEDFVTGTDLEAVKTYVYLKARLYFDPPTNSSLLSSIKEAISELEFRLNVAVDPKVE